MWWSKYSDIKLYIVIFQICVLNKKKARMHVCMCICVCTHIEKMVADIFEWSCQWHLFDSWVETFFFTHYKQHVILSYALLFLSEIRGQIQPDFWFYFFLNKGFFWNKGMFFYLYIMYKCFYTILTQCSSSSQV